LRGDAGRFENFGNYEEKSMFLGFLLPVGAEAVLSLYPPVPVCQLTIFFASSIILFYFYNFAFKKWPVKGPI